MTPQEARMLFLQIKIISNFIMSLVNTGSNRRWMGDRRKDNINPVYNQTVSGLYLCYYYGLPHRLYTPWGIKDIGGGGSGDWGSVFSKLNEFLGLVEKHPEEDTSSGVIGPLYGITKVGAMVLPEPVLPLWDPGPVFNLRGDRTFIKRDVGVCHREWNDLEQEFVLLGKYLPQPTKEEG